MGIESSPMMALHSLHRYILSRDGSAFEGMFSLDNIPNSDSAETLIMPHSESIQTYPHSHSHLHHRHSSPEGASDKSPILLTGDTAADFRSLLWALYTLPADVFAMPSTQPQLNRLIGIARIAHKYAFRTTESWALSVLTMCVCQAPDTPLGQFAVNWDVHDLIKKLQVIMVDIPLSKLVDILPPHVYKPWVALQEPLSRKEFASANVGRTTGVLLQTKTTADSRTRSSKA
ncbi:hypothetical protein C8R42DRAFT_723526 [Lentinula raphanica]|nr:hypothetical protein C8R42DRAFT_723526 [Lentinula raphanica]